jgi:hypothetical protein
VTQSFTVAKADQTITFGALGGKTFGDAPFTVSATTTSPLTVAFSSGTPAVCSLSGVTVTILGAGNCSVVASQAGDDDYNAATDVTQSFAVAKKGLTVTAPSVTRVLHQALGSVTASPTYSGWVGSDGVSVLDVQPTCGFEAAASTNAIGTFSGMVVCSGGSDNNYSFNYVAGSLTVGYAYSQFLQPINVDRSSRFKSGSTIPVKFQLLDANGVVQNDGSKTFTIKVTKLDSTPGGDVNETVVASSGDTGATFRWDSSGQLYIFNLSTKNSNMGEGTYRIDALSGTQVVVTGQVDIKR